MVARAYNHRPHLSVEPYYNLALTLPIIVRGGRAVATPVDRWLVQGLTMEYQPNRPRIIGSARTLFGTGITRLWAACSPVPHRVYFILHRV